MKLFVGHLIVANNTVTVGVIVWFTLIGVPVLKPHPVVKRITTTIHAFYEKKD